MPYSDLMTAPMRRELVEAGFQELRTPAEVDAFLAEAKDGLAMIVVNSICGCSAGNMRPAVVRALRNAVRPQYLGTVFAGHDVEATERARTYFTGYMPSSPAVALLKDGEVAYMLERHEIQGRHPQMIADDLAAAIERLSNATARA